MSSYVYIMFNHKYGTLYIGVTSDLVRRVYEHKTKKHQGFTQKYNVDKLGYYEVYEDITSAIQREKNLKGGSRARKIQLIEKINPQWLDLYDSLL